MKTFQSMAIGGCIVAALVIGLQALPDVQWLVVLAAGVFGLVALISMAIEAFSPSKARPAPQPVAQPVSQPIDMVLQPPQSVADRWSQPLAQPVVVDSQPPATGPQPARNRRPDLVERNVPWTDLILDEVPAVRRVPWLEEKVAPITIDDDPAELPDTPGPALPLPRRAPTAAEYPLVLEAWMKAVSMNATILTVYGSKDGRTHGWVSRVIAFYRKMADDPVMAGLEGIDSEFLKAVFHHELVGTCDMPGMVAARLGLEVDDDQLADLLAGLDQCDDCSAWYRVTGDCPCQSEMEVE